MKAGTYRSEPAKHTISIEQGKVRLDGSPVIILYYPANKFIRIGCTLVSWDAFEEIRNMVLRRSVAEEVVLQDAKR